jgi:hypothetical protein
LETTATKRVARIAAGGFDIRIQHTDVVRLSEDAKNARDMRYRLLPELLRTSDNVTPHVPLTPLTGNRIDAAALHDASLPGGSPTRDAMRLRPNRLTFASGAVARQCRADPAPWRARVGRPG